LAGLNPAEIDLWAVHPGGRSVLDSVEGALTLRPDALATSRGVLDRYGNMSSATIMFVLKEMLSAGKGQGCAMAFGPGLTAETMQFRAAG
jgi:alpha-pyrone synthase